MSSATYSRLANWRRTDFFTFPVGENCYSALNFLGGAAAPPYRKT
jgi:hypothetical protein